MNFKFLLLIVVFAPLQSAELARPVEHRCDSPSIIAYKAMSCCFKNDYHTLACYNYCWMLRIKLKCQEHVKDINRYFLKYEIIKGKKKRAKVNLIWTSPLHEAVHKGHVQAVSILCRAGANKNLRIKSDVQDETEKS